MLNRYHVGELVTLARIAGYRYRYNQGIHLFFFGGAVSFQTRNLALAVQFALDAVV